MAEQEKIIKLLDDYYGETRDESHKEEIADFVGSYYEDIKRIIQWSTGFIFYMIIAFWVVYICYWAIAPKCI